MAQEAGIVVATHSGLEGYDVLVQMWEHSGQESSLFRSPLRGVLTKGRAVSDFYTAAVCNLLFERYPRLRMASVENGASWVGDLLHRLDDAASRNPGYFTVPPRDAFTEHIWITPFWEDDIPSVTQDVPATRLVLGSDWPHAEGTRTPADFPKESLSKLPEADVQRIARDNALDLLGISLG